MRDYDSNYTMTRDRYVSDYDRGYGRNYERRDDDSGFFGSDDDDRPRYSATTYTTGYRTDDDREWRDRESGWYRDEERDYGPDQGRRGVPRNETARLIASDKVEGTPVYGRDREQLGSIHNFMVEKRSGKARYAVMKTSSGFLGLNERYFPIQWDELTYDTRVDGYHIDMTKDDLERRRSFDSRGRPTGIESRRDFGDRSYGDRNFRRYDRDYERSTW